MYKNEMIQEKFCSWKEKEHNWRYSGIFYDRSRTMLIEREQVIMMRNRRRSIRRNKSGFCAIR